MPEKLVGVRDYRSVRAQRREPLEKERSIE
jgi:hypothetical protein